MTIAQIPVYANVFSQVKLRLIKETYNSQARNEISHYPEGVFSDIQHLVSSNVLREQDIPSDQQNMR